MEELIWTEGSAGMLTQVVDYGVRDSKGRVVGGFVRVVAISKALGYSHDGFGVRCFSARDGVKFGALSGMRFAETREQAKELAAKLLEKARARATKAAAKGEGRQWRRA